MEVNKQNINICHLLVIRLLLMYLDMLTRHVSSDNNSYSNFSL